MAVLPFLMLLAGTLELAPKSATPPAKGQVFQSVPVATLPWNCPATFNPLGSAMSDREEADEFIDFVHDTARQFSDAVRSIFFGEPDAPGASTPLRK
jgi:hypothetical protein